jgi:hypothetical protein
VLWAICCSPLLAVPAAAQRPIDRICSAELIDENAPDDAYWSARFPATTASSLAPLEAQGQWNHSLRRLISLFDADSQFFEENRPAYDSLKARLEDFQARLESTDQVGRSTGIAGAADFRVRPSGPGYNALNTGLRIGPGLSDDQLRSLCYTSHNVHRYHERLTRWARLRSQAELQLLADRWRAFNDVGMTPYPWELMGNRLTGWLGSSDELAPPRRQMILLRPQVGAELDSHFNDRQNVVSVELIGAVQYVGDGGWYLGGSLVWTSPDAGPSGIGAMAHVAQWFKGGPVWRDRDGDGNRELGWILSIDVFDLFRGAPKGLLQRARLAAQAAAEAGGG